MQDIEAGHVRGARTMQPQEGFLEDVVGFRRMPGQMLAEAIETRCKRLVELAERLVIALGIPLHQRTEQVDLVFQGARGWQCLCLDGRARP